MQTTTSSPSTSKIISIGAFPRYDLTFDYVIEEYEDNRGDTKYAGWVSAYVAVPRITGVTRYELYFQDGNGLQEVWFADGNGATEFTVQREKNPAMDPWWIEIRSYFSADYDTEAEALDWVNGGNGSGLPRLQSELADTWYRLRTYTE